MDARPAVRQVFVRLPNWLGDALMARPFLAALRARERGAHITVAGPGPLVDLLAGDGAWDASFTWPPGDAAARTWRAVRPDAAYVLPPSFSSALHAWRAGARERVGFAADGRSPLLTRAVRRPSRGDLHLAAEYLALLGPPPAGAPPLPPPLPAPGGAAEQAAALLRAAALADRPLALVAPGAIYGPAKRWPAGRFAEVARALAARGFAVAACGGGADREACEAVAQAAPDAVTSLVGRTSLPVQAALCARAAIVVSNDSGMAHLAAAMGARVVAIFGSTSSAWTAPLGARVRIVQRPPVCAPCFRRTCRIGYSCLESVTVAGVLRAIEESSLVTGGVA